MVRRVAVGGVVVAGLLACGLGSPPEPGPGEVVTVIASRDLPAGHEIREVDLQWVAMPAEYVPDSVLREPDALVGRSLVHPVPAHYFLREERFSSDEVRWVDPRETLSVRDPTLRRLLTGMTTLDLARLSGGEVCLAVSDLVGFPGRGEVIVLGDEDQLEAVRAVPEPQRFYVARAWRTVPPPLHPCAVEGR